jgi:hypothetical protein
MSHVGKKVSLIDCVFWIADLSRRIGLLRKSQAVCQKKCKDEKDIFGEKRFHLKLV